jgi:protein-S-isoprenylcysteine O-methyltransferase Ste14
MREWTDTLARWRVPLGFVAAVGVAWLAAPNCRSLTAGVAIAAVGEMLRIWAAGHLEKGREVTTSGPYRYFAHPLYVGSSIMAVGLAVAARSIAAALLIALYMTATIGAAIRSEELFLQRKFGDAYLKYRHAEAPLSARRFDLARVARNREYRAVAGLAVAAMLLWWQSRCW